MKKAIATEQAPQAIGPYSQGVEAQGRMIFVSGQLPIDPATSEFAGDEITAQTKQSLTNIKAILEEAGASMDHIVKTTVLLKNIDDFTEMNKVYETFFNAPYPARAAYEVAKLPKNALIEIEAIAIV